MQAIITKYHGPTDTKGSRITASTESGIRITVPYDHALRGSEQVHQYAAIRLCEKMHWKGRLVMGGIKGGYVFVFDSEYGTEVTKPNSEDVIIVGE